MISRREFVVGMAGVFAARTAWANSPLYYADQGMAVSGFDAVSYFRSQAPMRGQADISVMWKGAEWRFASMEHREMFEANPRAFAPQFGGYCAYAVSRGHLLESDPRAWRIVDDKLYLIHSPKVEKIWEQDIAGNIALAEQNWPALLQG